MRVGIVSNLYPPDARGGAELVAQRVADALYQRGHEVFVLTTQPYEGVRSLFARVRERTLEVVYRFYPLNVCSLRHGSGVPFLVRALWHMIDLANPVARAAIRYVMQDERPDVVITHNLKGIGLSIAREIQARGVPHIHVLHDVQLSIPSGLLIAGQEQAWLQRSFLRRWYEKAVKRQIGTPNLVLSPSQFLADFYRARGLFSTTRLVVLPNPLPPGNAPELPHRRPQMRTRFLYVGQLEEHKGIPILLAALDAFHDEIELHVAGDGTLMDFVAARAQRDPRVTYHGFISLHNLLSLLENVDAVIVPSLCYENSPTVIYEAMLIGVPVIASRLGGIPELVEEDVTGLLVEPGRAQELAAAMRRIHDEQDAWWERTTLIRERAERYTLEGYINQLEEMMKEVITRRRSITEEA
ncbi:glycosyltransferase family 4 protein [Candidatus Uhrbacteria bacterium]|nr:glycosyltransferase family 4 protein [Candidatus Uhrbacteria bacterium]